MSESKTREFQLFTNGEQPAIDALVIMCKLMEEMDENGRRANLFYIADKFGFIELGETALRGPLRNR